MLVLIAFPYNSICATLASNPLSNQKLNILNLENNNDKKQNFKSIENEVIDDYNIEPYNF